MDIAVFFAEKWHTTPFDVLGYDIDDFILIANNMIEGNKTTKTTAKSMVKPKEKRIRVNDKTATGGWF